MKILRGINGIKKYRKAVVALGVFDGLHRGHLNILKATVKKARQIKGTSVVITFWPHPQKEESLYSLPHRVRMLEALGIDICIIISFNLKFSKISAEDFIEKILDIGVDCLKIEGRNRSPEYVATVTKAYRTIIDFIYAAKKRDKQFQEDLAKLKGDLIFKLNTVYHRGNSSGFFLGKPINEWSGCSGSQATEKKIYIGKITKYYKNISVAEILIQADAGLKMSDSVFIQGPTTGSIREEIISLEKDHQIITKAKKGEKVAIKTKTIVRKNDLVYLVKNITS